MTSEFYSTAMPRPRTTGLGRKKKTYTRIAVDYSHKLQILERLEKGGTVGEVIRAFYPNINNAEKKRKQKQISKWKKQANFIKSVCEEGKGCLENYRRRGDATVLPAQAESDIVLWLSTMRKEGCLVSAKMLELKALEVATDTGIPSESFSASYSWRRRFMRRHKLSVRARTRQGQTTSEDAAAARSKFRGEVRAAIVENNITQVFNADQTVVFFEYLPRKTITTRGEKTVWVKCSGKDKERATAMLLADWHGNKQAPFLVFKAGVSRHQHVHKENESKRHGFGVRLWKEIAPLQAKHDCQIYGNRTAWCNSDISVKFLDYHFGHRDNMHEKILLLWDDFSGHWTEEVTQYAASINVVLL